jgi:hypothetical protein
MGANVAKASSKSDVVNRAITDVLISNSSQCMQTGTTDQELKIGDITTSGCTVNISNISQTTSVLANFACSQSSANSADLQNKLAAALKSNTAATLSGLPTAIVSVSETKSVDSLVNEVLSNINMTNIASCVSSEINKQKMSIGGIKSSCYPWQSVNITDVVQSLIVKTVSKCVQSNANTAKAANDLNAKLDSMTTAANKGFSFGDPKTFLIIFIIVIALAGGVFAYSKMRSSHIFSTTPTTA